VKGFSGNREQRKKIGRKDFFAEGECEGEIYFCCCAFCALFFAEEAVRLNVFR